MKTPARKHVVFALILLTLLAAPALQATSISYSLGLNYNGTPPQALTPPWATVTITDVSGGVNITMTAVNLSAGESISDLYFNFGGATLPSASAFTWVSGSPLATVSVGSDAFHPGGAGAGKFDIRFAFPDDAANKFVNGDSVTYKVGGVTANDFNVLSDGSHSYGPFYTVAHVNSLGWIAEGGGSGPSEVPEPGTLGLLLMGVALMSGPALLRFRK